MIKVCWGNVNYYPMLNRLCDQFIQEWNACINNLHKLSMYCKFQKTFELEKYIVTVKNNDLKHKLEIETGRYYVLRDNSLVS